MKLPQSDWGSRTNSSKLIIARIHQQSNGVYPCRKSRNELGSHIGAYSSNTGGIKDKANRINTSQNGRISICRRL
jgi:hypothetical protein